MKTSKGSAVFKGGLIGDPVSHSLSPRLFRTLGRLLDRSIEYEARKVPARVLSRDLGRLRREGLRGVNVTIPHKKAVMRLLDGLSAEAKAIGAVNAVSFSGGRAKGHNTDADGFLDALNEFKFDANGKSALIFGAGGAARAAGYALGSSGARQVSFLGRSGGKARRIADDLQQRFRRTRYLVGPAAAELWVNATPLGMKGFPRRSPAPRGMPAPRLAFDLVYGRKTPFLREAKRLGARTLDGTSMLVFQALRAWELWTGRLTGRERKRLYRGIMRELR